MLWWPCLLNTNVICCVCISKTFSKASALKPYVIFLAKRRSLKRRDTSCLALWVFGRHLEVQIAVCWTNNKWADVRLNSKEGKVLGWRSMSGIELVGVSWSSGECLASIQMFAGLRLMITPLLSSCLLIQGHSQHSTVWCSYPVASE